MMRLVAINALVALAAALFLALALEAYLRLTVPPEGGDTSIYEYTTETRRYKVMRPEAAVTAWGKPLRTNRLGFRDEHAEVPAKRAGDFRVIVLGDSFTLGAGLDHAELYTTLLERRLGRRFPSLEVINLAVGGYNIVQYALVLEEVGLALEPDMVLVALFPENDFSMENYEGNRRVAEGREPPPGKARPWYEHLYAWRAYGARIAARLQALVAGEARADRDGREAADANRAAFARIVAAANEHRLGLAGLILPHTYELERQEAQYGRALRLCEAHRVPCLDLRPAFEKHGVDLRELRLNALDTHPDAEYHAVVAEALERFLAQRVLGRVAEAAP